MLVGEYRDIFLKHPSCPVVVPALADTCDAAVTLEAEATPYTLWVLDGVYDYAARLSEQWRKGEGFILVEHDIVPWPGALAELDACSEDWCGYHYPLGRAGKVGGSLGCVRFSDSVVAGNPDLPDLWEGRTWQELDGHVCAAVADATGRDHFHVHHPPVAHLREIYP